MNTRNLFAGLLGIVVLAVTVITLLAIWEVIEINVEHLLRKSLWSGITVVIGVLIMMLIYNSLYKPNIKPPKPPGMGD